jgi:hypothetical protein
MAAVVLSSSSTSTYGPAPSPTNLLTHSVPLQ